MKEWKKKCLELSVTTDMSWRQIAKEVGKPRSTVSDFLRATVKKGNIHEVVTEDNKPKFLFFDLETSMLKCYTWGLCKQYISLPQVIDDWYLICYSAKWLGSDEIVNGSVLNYKNDFPTLKEAEYPLIGQLWKLLDEADVVCAYNGQKFDKKKINAKFLEYGYPEPSPYKIVDPLLIVKGNFALTSNKMDAVSKLLDGEGKMSTNIQLWIDAMNGDEEALTYMQKYCDQDISELEAVYHAVKHWDKRAPNLALYYSDNKPRCNTCGSDKLTKLEKAANTNVSSFTAYRCEGCGKILRDRKNVLEKEKRDSLFMNVS